MDHNWCHYCDNNNQHQERRYQHLIRVVLMIPDTVRTYRIEIRPVKNISPSSFLYFHIFISITGSFLFLSLPVFKLRETLRPVLPRATLAYIRYTQ